MSNITGRPSYTDDQFEQWLEDLKPWLKAGNTISYAIDKGGLDMHRTTLYEKYRLNDWFSDKINRFRSFAGELVNEFFYKEVLRIYEKQKIGQVLTKEDYDLMKHFSEKHRTSQPFFIQRYEIAQVEPDKIGQILDSLEGSKSDYAKLADQMGNLIQSNNITSNSPQA